MSVLPRRTISLVAAAATVTVLGACSVPPLDDTDVTWRSTAPSAVGHSLVEEVPDAPAAEPAPQPATGSTADALATLATLPVKGRAPKTGYDRELFGSGWLDDVEVAGGHNGCDTRNDILRRDMTDVTTKPKTRDCVIATGVLHDVYTGTTIDFVRGQGTSNAVQIDHIVALSDAWQKGAQQLSDDERRSLANDPRNLQAVDGPTNAGKGDGDAATWLPPNRAYRCTYVSRQIEVKAVYRLWVTAAERDAMQRVLADC